MIFLAALIASLAAGMLFMINSNGSRFWKAVVAVLVVGAAGLQMSGWALGIGSVHWLIPLLTQVVVVIGVVLHSKVDTLR